VLAGRRSPRVARAGVLAGFLLLLSVAAGAQVRRVSNAGPAFGLAADSGSVLVADAGAGILRLRDLNRELVTPLPGIADVAAVDAVTQLAITGGGVDPAAAKLYRVVRGTATQVADLGHFEATTNPDRADLNSNPVDVVALPDGAALVADAGGNSLLHVSRTGAVDWVATLPDETVSTDNVKLLFNCPAGPATICGLPATAAASPGMTSVVIGPDGAYYVGELKGFPAPAGASRVWRIEPDARHARCGVSPDCSVVADGFTSIVDLAFDSLGRLYVVELDEASWFAVEVTGNPIGGTINVCALSTDTNLYDDCTALAAGLPSPLAITIDRTDRVHYLNNALRPGAAEVVTLMPRP
jgi:hypothetical protein